MKPQRRASAAWVAGAGMLVGLAACKSDPVDGVQQAASQMVGDARRAIVSAIQTATAVASDLQGSAAKMFTGLTADGKLSETATSLVSAAGKASTGIEKTVAEGTQIAPAAWEIAKAVNAAVDDQTVLEPIVQKAGDKDAVDKAVKGMPRVEVIDGVDVGFRQLDQLDTQKSVKERAFLVLWRRDDKLVGFVYRSRREIDLDALVKLAPKLVALFDKSL